MTRWLERKGKKESLGWYISKIKNLVGLSLMAGMTMMTGTRRMTGTLAEILLMRISPRTTRLPRTTPTLTVEE